VLAAGEARRIRQRVNDRLDELAAQGRPAGGKFFGYRRVTENSGIPTLEIVPEQAEAIRWAANAVLTGWSLTTIGSELRRRGHRGVLGGSWSTTAVRTMLTSPAVAGLRVHRGQIIGPGCWPPILAEDVWQAVRSKLSQPRIITTVRADGRLQGQPVTPASLSSKTARKYLLTGGLARCGECGAALVGCVKHFKKGRRVLPYLMCSRTAGGQACVGIMLDSVEKYVVDRLFVELDKPAFLAAVGFDDHAGRRDELARALSGIDQQRTELAGMWAAGNMNTTEWQVARSGLDQREQALRAQLALIPAPVARVDIGDVRGAWPEMTLDERREILRMFIEVVCIHRAKPGTRAFDSDRAKIEWRTL
jgi:hypothetical protein